MANKGKFINTTHSDNITTLVESVKGIINNPFYLYEGKSPTIVTYYNINTEKTTLDTALADMQTDLGIDAPAWFNKIENFYIYGMEQIQIQIENGEFGASATDITGEVFILPNTIIPYAGDYFKIDYIKEKEFLFRVTGVSHDTLDTSANLYKMTYILESKCTFESDLKIQDEYIMITNNIGTSFNAVLNKKKINLIEELEDYVYTLKKYYIDTFYNDRVQAFIYKYKGMRFYDPYLTQFLIENDIVKGSEQYVYITHQLPLKSFFSIEYDRSFFRCLEKRDLSNLRKYNTTAISEYIDGIDTSIFSTRSEDYLRVEFRYANPERSFYGILPCFTDELISYIESASLANGKDKIYNVIIKYFNSMNISSKDIDLFELDMHNNIKLFYTVPCIIYCLEDYIKRMMISNVE